MLDDGMEKGVRETHGDKGTLGINDTGGLGLGQRSGRGQEGNLVALYGDVVGGNVAGGDAHAVGDDEVEVVHGLRLARVFLPRLPAFVTYGRRQ